ncbi:alpha/beta hydrolase [Nocardia farcinica]|nr:alpha/beta hydrolase [Nocardia farcinica]
MPMSTDGSRPIPLPAVSRRRALAAVVAVFAAAGCAAGERTAAPPSVVTTPVGPLPATPDAPLRIAYGPDPDHIGDLYLPERGAAPYPVVVMVHGGGWSQWRDLDDTAANSTALARHGVAVWNIEYRRVRGGGGWPSTLADADDAVEALATVVQERSGHRLDLERVHVAGHSAGGHLAAWVAGRHTLPPTAPGAQPRVRPRSATLMAGVFDLELAVTRGHDAFVRALLDGAPDEVPDRYRIASPIAHLPVGIRIDALHGDADQVVSIEQSRRYIAAARAAGDNAHMHELPGVTHADFLDVGSPAWAAAQRVILHNIDTLD